MKTNPNLSSLIHAFTGLKVLVIGEAMLDRYVEGTSSRLSQEAPVPVVRVSDRKDVPGGAANTAVNLRCLGSQPRLLSVVGSDLEGSILQQVLGNQGVSTEHLLVHPARQTLAKHRVLANSQMLVRFDQGSLEPLDRDVEQLLIDRLIDLFPDCDAVLVSDYGYGILTPQVIQVLTQLQSSPKVFVVDSRNLAAYRSVGVTAVKPNYEEAVQLLGIPKLEQRGDRIQQITAAKQQLLEATGAQIVAVTLDADGALILQRGEPAAQNPYRTYAQPGIHTRTTGAGDTFISALTLSLAAHAPTATAAELAAAAAAIVVAKAGTATCSSEELQEALCGFSNTTDKYLSSPSHLAVCIAFHRQQGRRIVLTNGCFDILHRGHITYLNQAKALGDVLIVGVNSDASVRRLKGGDRPLNSLEDRIQVLAALSCIDHIVAFHEDTPINLVRAIRPDIFVKGGDYTRELLPEAPVVEELGGRVEILPYLPDRSTTSLVNRIRQVDNPPNHNSPDCLKAL